MNIKKKALSLAVIAGLTFSCVPQAQANECTMFAGALAGFKAGLSVPLAFTNPILYAIDTLVFSGVTSVMGDILTWASGSSKENICKENDFSVGFKGSALCGAALIAFLLASKHVAFNGNAFSIVNAS